MCKNPTSTIIRTRSLRHADHPKLTGYGTLHVIEYVKKILDKFQGVYSDGTHWHFTDEDIKSHPKLYRLRKENGHHNCYQLVITRYERYRKLKIIEPLLGPKQSTRDGVSKVKYHLSRGRRITDGALKKDERVDCFKVSSADIHSAIQKENEQKGLYLRETLAKGLFPTELNGTDEDRVAQQSSRTLVVNDHDSPHDSAVEMKSWLE